MAPYPVAGVYLVAPCRLVGGLEVLTEIEGVATDKDDKPMVSIQIFWFNYKLSRILQEDIVIINSTVFIDPYEEAELKVRVYNPFYLQV